MSAAEVINATDRERRAVCHALRKEVEHSREGLHLSLSGARQALWRMRLQGVASIADRLADAFIAVGPREDVERAAFFENCGLYAAVDRDGVVRSRVDPED